MEANRRSIASSREEEEERGAAGPARRSLRRWSRPTPYTPSPRRFISDFLSKPSLPITDKATLVPTLENDREVALDDREFAQIEQYLKGRTFSRDEADCLLKVIRLRTPALSKDATLSFSKSPTSTQSESKQSGLLPHPTITWRPGDSVYSKANALGCSPIDIAKAYMRDLSSSRAKPSTDSENAIDKNANTTNSRISWPGANLSGNSTGCSTPQLSRGKTVQDAPPSRNSYAHSPFSRSTFKIKNDRDSCDLFSTGKKRRMTTLDGAKNQKAKLQDDTPFRFVDSEANREDTLMTFAQRGAYPLNRSQHIPQSSLERKSKDVVALNGASSLWVHNRRSTETAQKILSHLERAIPSSSEKPPLQRQINHELPTGSLSVNNKMKESLQVSRSTYQKMPDVNMDGGAAKSNATATKKNSDMGGFGFTFPVTAVNMASSEPPPTPTMPLPRALPVSGNLPAVPTFSFGSSSSSPSSHLVFSFGSSSNASPILEEPPTFKFGSEKRRLSFGFSDKGAVCC